MKPRRVIVTLELQTALPLSQLRDAYWHRVFETRLSTSGITIFQVQANVIRPKKAGKK